MVSVSGKIRYKFFHKPNGVSLNVPANLIFENPSKKETQKEGKNGSAIIRKKKVSRRSKKRRDTHSNRDISDIRNMAFSNQEQMKKDIECDLSKLRQEREELASYPFNITDEARFCINRRIREEQEAREFQVIEEHMNKKMAEKINKYREMILNRSRVANEKMEKRIARLCEQRSKGNSSQRSLM